MYIKTKYYNPQKCLILAVNELDKKKNKKTPLQPI